MKRRSLPARKDALEELARRLELDPCNQDGADKSWVLRALRSAEKLFAAPRIDLRRRADGSLP